MSQFFVGTSNSTPVPPQVPTSFTTDVQGGPDSTTPTGTAVTGDNNFQILGQSSPTDNDFGIRTDVNPNSTKNIFVELTNRIHKDLSTLIAGNAAVPILTLANNAAYNFETQIVGIANPAGNSGVGFSLFGTIVCSGGNAVLVNTQDKIANKSAAPINLSDSNADMTVVGNVVSITVTGSANSAITWKLVSTYTKVGI